MPHRELCHQQRGTRNAQVGEAMDPQRVTRRDREARKAAKKNGGTENGGPGSPTASVTEGGEEDDEDEDDEDVRPPA